MKKPSRGVDLDGSSVSLRLYDAAAAVHRLGKKQGVGGHIVGHASHAKPCKLSQWGTGTGRL